jgi:alkylation response protein AidB-like acyl-CoA dehydrogenase
MNFELTEEQQQLRDSLQRLVERTYSFDKRKPIVASPAGHSREVWRQLGELGALGIALPEPFGSGGTAVDTSIVMEVLGAHIVVEPYVPAIVLGAGIIARAGNDEQKQAILPRVADGERLLAFAHTEADARYELAHVQMRAAPNSGGFVLDGDKTIVLGGAAADTLIVSARVPDGITLFIVDANAPGVTRRAYPTHDEHRVADIKFEAVRVGPEAVVGPLGGGLPIIEHAVERAIAALCAEALGNMVALFDMTASYVKTRKQFGVAIGTFQVLQHRLADMLMRVEQARSMSYLVATTVESSDERNRKRVVAAAKAMVGQASRFVGQGAIQLHGAIGLTDEAAVSHYFKRLTAIGVMFGDADYHVAKFADLAVKNA